MTPKQAKDARLLRAEIKTLRDRQDLTEDCYRAHQDSVDTLIAQEADWTLVEENRDKATFYYESYLDLIILIGKLSRKLSEMPKT